MSLKLMYITNNTAIATIAENAGVDRIFVDLEFIGKEERQHGLDTVKSKHSIQDVENIRKCINESELMVRINPIHGKTLSYSDSKTEIEKVIDAGADIIMLPMFRTLNEVESFLQWVNGRVKTQLLVETVEACKIIDEFVRIKEVDEVHIGLNDLHLAMHKKFMFQLLSDGTVDALCSRIKGKKPFGFGGIARLGHGDLPAEYIIREHYRIGSTRAILSRSFCNANQNTNLEEINYLFISELKKIRQEEIKVSQMTSTELDENRLKVQELVSKIISRT